jgi:hypothetical protein
MAVVSPRPLDAVMSKSESSKCLDREPASSSKRCLPIFLSPLADEAMLSWLLRLAARLRVSVHAVARQTFGIDDPQGRSQWWCRPDPQTVVRISERTGLSIDQVREMTLLRWSPAYRDDEANIRFSGRRFETNPLGGHLLRLVLCGECLEADTDPYLRLSWMLGWLAVCPYHHRILIARCPKCRTRVRHAPLRRATAFTPHLCMRCGVDLLGGIYTPAHPYVIRLQAAMFAAKCEGTAQLPGFGRLSWQEMVALADVILGTFWNEAPIEERQQVYWRVSRDMQLDGLAEGSSHDSRYGSLALLAWFLERWPHGPGSEVGIDLLSRWSSAKRNRVSVHLGVPDWNDPWNPGPNDIEPAIQARLREFLESARAA